MEYSCNKENQQLKYIAIATFGMHQYGKDFY